MQSQNENMKDLERLEHKFKLLFSVLDTTLNVVIKEKNTSEEKLDKLYTLNKDNEFADYSEQEMIHTERRVFSQLKYILKIITTKMEEVRDEMEK